MRSHLGRTRTGVVALLIVMGGAFAGSALAYRRANSSQTAAVRSAIRAYLPRCSSPGGRLIWEAVDISTANPRYAEGGVVDNARSCFAFDFFVKRANTHTNTWKVIGIFPDSAEPCSSFRELPEAVIKDFQVEGINHTGYLGAC